MRFLLCILMFGCGGTTVDCEDGMHRSGDGCAPDRVFEEPDTGSGSETSEP